MLNPNESESRYLMLLYWRPNYSHKRRQGFTLAGVLTCLPSRNENRELMPVLSNWKTKERLRKCSGMSLIEVVIAMAIVALIFGGTIQSYIQSSQRIKWSGYSLAAQSLAQETIEQA